MSRVLLLAAALGAAQRSYSLYQALERSSPGSWMQFIRGTGPAPEQYRIGVKLVAWFFVRHLHWGFRHSFGLMDALGSVAAVLTLYDVLEHEPWFGDLAVELKWFASAAFVMLTCFYLSWVEPFFRPETLPVTGLVAAITWLWCSPRMAVRSARREAWVTSGLVVLAIMLSFVRADVMFMLSAGMLLASAICWRPSSHHLSRRTLIASSAICCVISAAIQIYLMTVRYPHASYGAVPVLMARHSFRHPLNYVPFLLFIIPVAWTVLQFLRQRKPANNAHTGLLAGGVLYFLSWAILGKLNEVRIYIPVAIAIAPLTVEFMVRCVSQESTAALEPAGAQI